MRIFLIYPGPTHSTYDVAHGYEKALIKSGHVVKSFYYHDYLAFYDGAYTYWQENNSDYERKLDDHIRAASEHVVIEAVKFVPEVVLIVAGGALHRWAHELLFRLDLPLVLLLTESPYIDNTQATIINAGHIEAVLTNDKNSVTPLNDATCKPVYYLPHSYDPDIHHPGPADAEHTSDIFFHGTLWPERDALFKEGLRGLPYNVRVTGYTLEDDLAAQRANLMDNEELACFYRGASIALNHHRTHTYDETEFNAWSLGPRAFEIAACGAFQLCDDTRPELNYVFGGTVATYNDVYGLRALSEYFMLFPDERAAMAQGALQQVQCCTFDDRANNILIPILEGVL